jgi:hypothetical protein
MALRFSILDRPSIRRLKVGEKITEHGITAERLAAGDLSYSINVMVDGARIHRVIGRESEGVTRTQCEEFSSARNQRRERGACRSRGAASSLSPLARQRTTTSSGWRKGPGRTLQSRAGSSART